MSIKRRPDLDETRRESYPPGTFPVPAALTRSASGEFNTSGLPVLHAAAAPVEPALYPSGTPSGMDLDRIRAEVSEQIRAEYAAEIQQLKTQFHNEYNKNVTWATHFDASMSSVMASLKDLLSMQSFMLVMGAFVLISTVVMAVLVMTRWSWQGM